MPPRNHMSGQRPTTDVKTVAIVGASAQTHKFGNRAVREFRAQGFRVVPINRHEVEIEGLKVYRSVLDVPGQIDVVTLYVPPSEAVAVLTEVAVKGIPEVWINPGADSPAVIQRARELGIEPVVACSLTAVGESW